MQKNTEELNNELKEASDIRRFIKENEEELLSEKLSELLNDILKKKGMTKAEVIKKGDLTKSYTYELFKDKKKRPSRDKLIRFAIGAGLDLDETQTLLKHAKYAPLYARNKRDGVIIYAINNKKSSVDCDILLSETGEEPLE